MECTSNVWTLDGGGVLKELKNQPVTCSVRITDVQDANQIWDTKYNALFSSGKECGIKEAVVVFVVDAAMSGNSWKFIPGCAPCM